MMYNKKMCQDTSIKVEVRSVILILLTYPKKSTKSRGAWGANNVR